AVASAPEVRVNAVCPGFAAPVRPGNRLVPEGPGKQGTRRRPTSWARAEDQGRIPQPHSPVGTPRGQELAVRAEDHGKDPAGEPFRGGAPLPGGGAPQPHRLVLVRRRQCRAVVAEGHGTEPARIPLEGGALLARGYVPQLHLPAFGIRPVRRRQR